MKYRQLAMGIVCMILISNLQYGWTLFVDPLAKAHGWERAAVQVTFSIFIATQAWTFPFMGHVVDRWGPRAVGLVGGICVAASWCLDAMATSLVVLYAGGFLGGLGTGCVLSVVYGNALKWTDARRGLIVGLTSAGYGLGSILMIGPLMWTLSTYGYETAFLVFGLMQGGALVAIALMLRVPAMKDEDRRSYDVRSTLRSPAFWVMYVMFMLVGTGGLLFAAQLAPMAKDFKVANVPLSFLGWTASALGFALALDRVLNGVSRPFFGWVSDRIGREVTMFIAFACESAAVFALMNFAHDPVLFVLFTAFTFFAWGEIHSLFPTMCTDLYGKRFAATNYGLLYTAKGVGAFLIPVANLVAGQSWHGVFMFVVICDLVAALLAIFVLLPLRQSMQRPG